MQSTETNDPKMIANRRWFDQIIERWVFELYLEHSNLVYTRPEGRKLCKPSQQKD